MKLTIYRYDPDKDSAPRYQDYDVKLDQGDRMLLDALVKAKVQDDSLAFRRSSEESRTSPTDPVAISTSAPSAGTAPSSRACTRDGSIRPAVGRPTSA